MCTRAAESIIGLLLLATVILIVFSNIDTQYQPGSIFFCRYRKKCEMLKVSNTDFRELRLPTERSGDTIFNELLRVPEKNAFKPRWSRS
uniref:Nucleolar protein 4 n=1 Tax=Ornithorhynchus anatinus TaxID=9258 RepID=A0A6I8N6I1_ORNAN